MKKLIAYFALLLLATLSSNYSVAQISGLPSPEITNAVSFVLAPFKYEHSDLTLRKSTCSPGEPRETTTIKSKVANYKLRKAVGTPSLYNTKLAISLDCSIHSRLTSCVDDKLVSEHKGPLVPPVQTLVTDLVVYNGTIIHVGQFVNTSLKDLPEDELRCGKRIPNIRKKLLPG